MAKTIDVHNDVLSISISKLTNEEVCTIIEEIKEFKATGLLASSTNLRRIAKEIHDQYQLPNDVRVIEDVILYEAARRFYNWRNADFY